MLCFTKSDEFETSFHKYKLNIADTVWECTRTTITTWRVFTTSSHYQVRAPAFKNLILMEVEHFVSIPMCVFLIMMELQTAAVNYGLQTSVSSTCAT